MVGIVGGGRAASVTMARGASVWAVAGVEETEDGCCVGVLADVLDEGSGLGVLTEEGKSEEVVLLGWCASEGMKDAVE